MPLLCIWLYRILRSIPPKIRLLARLLRMPVTVGSFRRFSVQCSTSSGAFRSKGDNDLAPDVHVL